MEAKTSHELEPFILALWFLLYWTVSTLHLLTIFCLVDCYLHVSVLSQHGRFEGQVWAWGLWASLFCLHSVRLQLTFVKGISIWKSCKSLPKEVKLGLPSPLCAPLSSLLSLPFTFRSQLQPVPILCWWSLAPVVTSTLHSQQPFSHSPTSAATTNMALLRLIQPLPTCCTKQSLLYLLCLFDWLIFKAESRVAQFGLV